MGLSAAIDIGTNTAHLIVGRKSSDERSLEVVFRKRHYVFLAVKGTGRIAEDASSRLFQALEDFKEILAGYHIKIPRIAATEAMRRASNGKAMIDEIQHRYGWKVEVITGQEEAQFVLQGVRAAMDIQHGHFLIMDIGGGSVEFIAVEDDHVRIIESFPVGIANLTHRFHQVDPIPKSSVEAMKTYLESELQLISEYISHSNVPVCLIGTAGTFEVFRELEDSTPLSSCTFTVSREAFGRALKEVVLSTEKERASLSWIPPQRIKNIVVAMLLLDFILDKVDADSFLVSEYALKEGILVSSV